MLAALRAFASRTHESVSAFWGRARDPLSQVFDTHWPESSNYGASFTYAPPPETTQKALVRPDGLVKIKAQDLSHASRAVLIEALEKLDFPEAKALAASLREGKVDASKRPHFVRNRQDGNPERMYVLSPTWEQGSFGKFRHVLELSPNPRFLAAKEFRGPERFFQDMSKLRLRLDTMDLSSDDLGMLKFTPTFVDHFLARKLLTYQEAMAIKDNPYYTAKLVDEGVLTAEQGRSILLNASFARSRLPADKQLKLRLTRFAKGTDIARESTLLELAESPLLPLDYIYVDGRLLVISAIKDGELAQAKNLSQPDTAILARHLLACMGSHMAIAHAAGVVHRDIKPENILFDLEGGDLLPCDFGLGTTLDNGRATGLVGTPGFYAPELSSGLSYGQEVDVFSLGLTAAKLVLGCDLLALRGRSQAASTAAFERLQEKCPKRSDGMYDLPKLIADTDGTPEERQVRARLATWYARDPELATYVFSKMLEVEPSERHTMAEIATQFEPDPDGMRRALTPSANKQRVENTHAMMRAFGEAYLAADAELVAGASGRSSGGAEPL